MGKSQFLPALFQAMVLAALSLIVYHHLMEKAYDKISQSEAWQNFTKAADVLDGYGPGGAKKVTFTGNHTTGTLSLNTSSYNQNTANNTSRLQEDEPFYTKALPLELLFNLVLLSGQYFWQLWLERTFPGRPRHTEAPQGERDYGSERHEEAVVQKWVAQGKVRRASLSWWNTFVKWVLNMTLGQVLVYGVGVPVLDAALKRASVKSTYEDVKWGLMYRPWLPLLSLRPLASLLSFIIVPAHKRIVFMEGLDLLWNVFLGFFAGIVFPWLSTTEIVQMIVANITAEADKMAGTQPVLPLGVGGGDEL